MNKKKASPSKTADAVAAIRAAHLKWHSPVIFNDPYAFQLTSSGWAKVVHNKTLYSLVSKFFLRPLLPTHGQILARAQVALEAFDQFAQDNFKKAQPCQCVIIGAGYDSLALRNNPFYQNVKFFELDLIHTQNIKRQRIQKAGWQSKTQYISTDLSKESVPNALQRSTFNAVLPTFFIWLGVTFYLEEATIAQTLRGCAQIAAQGSQLVVDYRISARLLSGADLREAKFLTRFVSFLGEDFKAEFDTKKFPLLCEQNGWDTVMNYTPEVQQAKYFSNRNDWLKASAFSGVLLTQKA